MSAAGQIPVEIMKRARRNDCSLFYRKTVNYQKSPHQVSTLGGNVGLDKGQTKPATTN